MCAGGGVTGAVYEIGALRALEEVLGRSVLDFDLYVGVSGGAFVASLLANGISPVEMYDEVVMHGSRPFGVSAAPVFSLGLGDLLTRASRAPRILSDAFWTAMTGEGRNLADLGLSLFELLPAGLLDTTGMQRYLEQLFRMRGRGDSWRDLERELYIVAVDLDDGQAVAFGEDGHRDVPVSRAVQASIALPGLYRPVRIGGRDYVDGGVKKTAHINLAIRHHADLVVCINPIVPIRNDTRNGPLGGHLSEKGVTYVLDQALRIMLHGRMQYGLERYELEHPDVDILLIEPERDDPQMFSFNIMRMSARRLVAENGYRSVVDSFAKNGPAWARMLKRHGIPLRKPGSADPPARRRAGGSPLARTLDGSLDRLDGKLRRARVS
ncbi:MAG: patatin-like phospholipase family protein [Vicinamibacteria bacterium]